MRKDGWSVRDIRNRCTELRAVLEASPELCPAEQLAAYWPGGAENRLPGRGGWIYCYAQYSSFWRRGERIGSTDVDDAAGRQAALDAFRDKPITVELVTLAEDGKPRTVAVHPKSFDTLSLIDEIDGNVRWLLDRIESFGQEWSAEDQLRRADALREVTELQLTQCWILTTPGIGAPFDPSADLPPLPADYRTYDVLDVLTIMRAHHEIHRKRMDLICRWLQQTGTKGEEAADWTTFASAAAKSQHTVVEHLLRYRSMGAWVSQAAVTWREDLDAHERQDAMARHPTSTPMPEMIG